MGSCETFNYGWVLRGRSPCHRAQEDNAIADHRKTSFQIQLLPAAAKSLWRGHLVKVTVLMVVIRCLRDLKNICRQPQARSFSALPPPLSLFPPLSLSPPPPHKLLPLLRGLYLAASGWKRSHSVEITFRGSKGNPFQRPGSTRRA